MITNKNNRTVVPAGLTHKVAEKRHTSRVTALSAASCCTSSANRVLLSHPWRRGFPSLCTALNY